MPTEIILEDHKPLGGLITIMVGLPGSGKTSWVARHCKGVPVVSADHYFTDPEGNYRYRVEDRNAAHEWAFRHYLRLLGTLFLDGIVVDNTNTTSALRAPYILAALAMGGRVRLVHLPCTPAEAYARNIHGVSMAVIEGMFQNFQQESFFTPYWQTDPRVTLEIVGSKVTEVSL